MKRLNTIVLYSISVILLAMLLPWLFSFVTSKPLRHPFTLYSSVINDFARVNTTDKGNLIYESISGKKFSEEQFDSILPFFYYRQLIADNRLPNNISVQDIKKNNFIFRSSPAEANAPSAGLFMLLESAPRRVDLELSTDVFRITGTGIEFIDMATNKQDINKSQLFTKGFKDTGFSFPCTGINGDPNPRKEYDLGYLITDSKDELFNLRMISGIPYLKKIDKPVIGGDGSDDNKISNNMRIRRMFITEFASRNMLGFINTFDNDFYVISIADNKWYLLPFKVNAQKQNIMIIGNIKDWTVDISDKNGSILYAISNPLSEKMTDNTDESFKLLKTMNYTVEKDISDNIALYLFPFKISFSTSLDKWMRPHIFDFSAYALIFNVMLVIIYLLILYFRRKFNAEYFNRPLLFSQVLCVAVFGMYMFIPLLIFNK